MTNGRSYLWRVPFLPRHDFSGSRRHLRSSPPACVSRGVQIGCRMKLAMQIAHDRLTLWGQRVACVERFLGVQREKTSCQTSPSVVSFGLCMLVMMEEMSLRRGEEEKKKTLQHAGVHQGHTVDLNPSLRRGSPGSRLANYHHAVRCVT